MTEPISLACGELRCEIVPALGAAVAGLWLGELPVLRSTRAAVLGSVRDAGCYPLVPFSNRIGHATLSWNGTSHPLLQNFRPEPHAIHGIGWQRPWSVLESHGSYALLAFEHRGEAGWPFAFDCSQALRLGADALEIALSITNRSDQVAPCGLGWHPYFVKRPGSHLRFAATGRWEMGIDKLPTQRIDSPGLDVDCAALDVDHCFDGWSGDFELHDPLVRVRLGSDLRRLVVFTNGARDFVAVEPVSHVNNAVNMAGSHDIETLRALGVALLQPGQSMSAWMRIGVSRQA